MNVTMKATMRIRRATWLETRPLFRVRIPPPLPLIVSMDRDDALGQNYGDKSNFLLESFKKLIRAIDVRKLFCLSGNELLPAGSIRFKSGRDRINNWGRINNRGTCMRKICYSPLASTSAISTARPSRALRAPARNTARLRVAHQPSVSGLPPVRTQ